MYMSPAAQSHHDHFRGLLQQELPLTRPTCAMAGVKAGVARPAVAGEALCRARTTPARLMQGQASRPTSCIASARLGGSLG